TRGLRPRVLVRDVSAGGGGGSSARNPTRSGPLPPPAPSRVSRRREEGAGGQTRAAQIVVPGHRAAILGRNFDGPECPFAREDDHAAVITDESAGRRPG